MKPPKARILKVQEVGDYWKGKTIPSLSLKGQWLYQAGIHPNSQVEITNPQPGILVVSTFIVEEGESE